MNWNRIKHIIIPRILWYISGRFIWNQVYSYYWLNIKNREPLWSDAIECDKKYCRFCGKGKKKQ